MFIKLKKLLLITIFAIGATILSSYFFSAKVSAHPIDNTDFYLYYSFESDNAEIPSNEISGYLYINWYQAASLVQEETGKSALELDIYELVGYDTTYQAYVAQHLFLQNNDKPCEMIFSSVPQDQSEFPLDIGKRIVMKFICEDKVVNLKLKNTLFLDTFQYSSNFINLFRGEVLIDRLETNQYFNEFKIDIKEDGTAFMEKPEAFTSTNGGVSPLDPAYNEQNFSNQIMKENPNRTYWDRVKLFVSNLKNVGDVANMNPLYLILLLFLLGFLHTIEAGHSKVVLTSAMLHKNMSIKGGVMYAIIFTVTHIGDILLLGLSLLIVNNFVDVYAKFALLEKAAIYSLLFIGVYLLFKSISDLVQSRLRKNSHKALEHDHTHEHHDHGHDHDHIHASGEGHTHSHDFDPNKSFKDQLIVGFLTGLAPCVFGWSILMLIVSVKKLWLLIPAILSFSLGIFVALLLVVFLIGKFKKQIFNRLGWLTEISPIISASILIAYAVYMIS